MIWKYKIVTADPDGQDRYGYGCPVTVRIAGQQLQIVYQFPGSGQRCAAVHWQSGAVIAEIFERHKGYPQERAQAAIRDRLAAARTSEERAWQVIETAPKINTIPLVIGSTGRPHESANQ